MKKLVLYLFLLPTLLVSCGPSFQEKCAKEEMIDDSILCVEMLTAPTFDDPFPGRNRNLSKIFGDTIFTYGICRKENYFITSNRKSNSITDLNTGYKLTGKVSKYRGRYYLSEQINDTSYRIIALQITDSTVFGFRNASQYSEINKEIKTGQFPKLVKYVDKNKIAVRLHTNKKEIKKLFNQVLSNATPLLLVRKGTDFIDNEKEDIDTLTGTNDYELLSKAFPNPATDFVNIELQRNNVATPYILYDLNGKVVLQGQLLQIKNRIDISHLPNGVYNMFIVAGQLQRETIKIIKTK